MSLKTSEFMEKYCLIYVKKNITIIFNCLCGLDHILGIAVITRPKRFK